MNKLFLLSLALMVSFSACHHHNPLYKTKKKKIEKKEYKEKKYKKKHNHHD